MTTVAPKLAVPTRYTHKQGHVSDLGPSQVPSSARITEYTGPKNGVMQYPPHTQLLIHNDAKGS